MSTDPRPRILFVGPMLGRYPGWVPNPAEIIAPRLVERGYSCLLTSAERNRYLRLLDILNIMVRARGEYDLACLQVYSGSAFVVNDLASLMGHWLQKPMIMVLHGGGLPDFMVRHPGWTERVLGRAKQIVTPSSFLADAAAKEGFHTRVIPHGVEIDQYPYSHRACVSAKLIWMRTFHEIYNPHMAVEVLTKVRETQPDAILTMAGQDKGELISTKVFADKLGVTEHLRFVGFLDVAAKQREFANNDIYLNTNWVDNHPISVLEAAAFGLPVVATAVGGLPFMVKNNENGILVPPGNSTAMASAVLRLINDPRHTAMLSANGRRWAEKTDWSCVLPQWEEMFNQVYNH